MSGGANAAAGAPPCESPQSTHGQTQEDKRVRLKMLAAMKFSSDFPGGNRFL
jgi:hypothetical protein